MKLLKPFLPCFAVFVGAAFLFGCTDAPEPEQLPKVVHIEIPPTQAVTTSANPAEPTLKDSDGRFEVYFPKTPQRVVQQATVDIGTIELVQHLCQVENTQTWSVSYADYPAELLALGSGEQLLRGVYQRLLSDFNARSDGGIQWDSTTVFTDMHFKATVPRKGWHLQYYLLLQGHRLYQVGLHSAVGPISTQDSLDLFGSFGLWK